MQRRFAIAALTLALLLGIATPAHGQWLSFGVGPAFPLGQLGDRRTTGVAAMLSLEHERLMPAVALRGELGFVNFAGVEDDALMGPAHGTLRHFTALAHVIYTWPLATPGASIEPYVGAGGGIAWRSISAPESESGIAGVGALLAGARLGPREKAVFIEGRTQAVIGGPSAGTRGRATMAVLLLGVGLGKDR